MDLKWPYLGVLPVIPFQNKQIYLTIAYIPEIRKKKVPHLIYMPLRLKHNTNLKSDRNKAHITCTPVVDTLSTLNSISSANESNDP